MMLPESVLTSHFYRLVKVIFKGLLDAEGFSCFSLTFVFYKTAVLHLNVNVLQEHLYSTFACLDSFLKDEFSSTIDQIFSLESLQWLCL